MMMRSCHDADSNCREIPSRSSHTKVREEPQLPIVLEADKADVFLKGSVDDGTPEG